MTYFYQLQSWLTVHSWRVVVSPIIKTATLPANDFENYHPVSDLSFISKLVERVVVKQLLEHIHINNLDNPYQSAYKTGHSTEPALLSMKMKFTYLCQETNLLP